MTPYYDHAGITIYNANSYEMLPELEPVEVVLTDPPYGISKRPRSFQAIQGPASEWDTSEFTLDWALLIDAPVLAVMPGIANLPRLPLSIGTRDYRWTFSIHVSNGMTRAPVGYGNWIACVLYATPDAKVYAQKSDAGRVSISGTKPNHPSPKPIQAMDWLVSRMPASTILDPFAGSGTTLLAAHRAQRNAIGIEINEAYCEVAAKRLEQLALL